MVGLPNGRLCLFMVKLYYSSSIIRIQCLCIIAEYCTIHYSGFSCGSERVLCKKAVWSWHRP